MIKNNTLNLNKPLDNDELSAKQERHIRSLVHYKLEMTKEDLLRIYYKDKITEIEFVDLMDINQTNLKRNTYKFVIYSLLEQRKLKIKNKELLSKVKKVLRRDRSEYEINLPIKEKLQTMYSLLERVLANE